MLFQKVNLFKKDHAFPQIFINMHPPKTDLRKKKFQYTEGFFSTNQFLEDTIN